MIALFVDSNVPLYAVGGPHPHKDACVALLTEAAHGRLHLHASMELLQEYLFHRLRRCSRDAAVAEARHVADLMTLHPFDHHVADTLLDLVATTRLRGRDAVHAATALAAGFDHLVTTDIDFAAIPRLRAVAPDDALLGRSSAP